MPDVWRGVSDHLECELMARWYKTPSKRLIARGSGGRFRKSTLADIGMSECGGCGAIFTPDYSSLKGDFIDPRAMRDLQDTCPECREK